VGPRALHPGDLLSPHLALREAPAGVRLGLQGGRDGSMNLVWAVVIVFGVAGLAVAAMLLVRRGAPEGSYFEDGDRASGIFGVLATGFAVLYPDMDKIKSLGASFHPELDPMSISTFA